MDDTLELTDFTKAFPTNNQHILDTTLKSMLISMRSSLHADMMSCVQTFRADVRELGGRVDHLEQKICEFASSYNSLVDSHNERRDDDEWLKTKMANSEDRSKGDNIKICIIPKSV